MLETLSNIPVWGWILVGVAIFIMAVIIFGDDTDQFDPVTWLPLEQEELEEDSGMTDIITCSVPGQKQMAFTPKQYQSYSIDSYDWFVELQLINGKICYLPSMYTTVIDQSFQSVSEKAPV